MENQKKKQWKLFLIVSGSIFTVFLLFALFMGLFIKKQISNMVEVGKSEGQEKQRIRELPDIYGVIVTNHVVTNPVSERILPMYAMRVGAEQKTSGARISGSTGYSHYQFPDCIIDYPSDTKLRINGRLYPIDFKRVILTKVGKLENEKRGIPLETFKIVNTDHGYTSIKDALDYDSYDSIRKIMKSRVRKLKGTHKIIDSYLAENKNYGVDILLLREYKFNVGDTLVFKGKIENNSVVPLF